jgi:hypothetical protein
MIHCSKCSYAWNPDSAKNCVQCKCSLDAAVAARRGDTLNENEPVQSTRRQTVAEGVPPLSGSGAKVPEREGGQRRQTVFAGTASPASQQAAATGPGGQSTAARKIVGVLITYSWQEQGQIFPILEGRNLIGKDPNECDICIPQDTTLSAVNTFITYRRQFIIGDRVSMSGTDVNGEPVEAEFVHLENYARIRTGSTHWTFVAIQPPE